MADGMDDQNPLAGTPPPALPDVSAIPTSTDSMDGNALPPDVNTGVQQILASNAIQPVASPIDPPTGEHLDRMHRVMNVVSNILSGGSGAYRMQHNPDGTTVIEPAQATTGEKWGRIAAAALTGAAAGLSHSVGTNALPQAAAAGFQAGMQLPVEQTKQREQEASFQNKQLLQQANRIHLTQQTYILAQQAKMNDQKMNKETEDTLNQYAGYLSDGGTDLGKMDPSDPNAAMNLARTQPGAMDAFLGKGNKVLRYVTGPDHQMHMIMTDKAWEQQRNSEPMPVMYEDTGTNGEPTLRSEMAPVNADTRENINTHNAAVMKSHYANLGEYSKAQKAQADAAAEPQRLTQEQQRDAERAATDKARIGVEQGRLEVERQKLAQGNMQGDGIGYWGQLLSDPHSGVTMANVPSRIRNAVVQAMTQNNQRVARPLTADEIKRSDLATNAISNIEEAQSILQRRPDLFGPSGLAKTKFSEAIGRGDPDALRYKTAVSLANLPAIGIHGVRGKWAMDDLANLDSNLYRSPQTMAGILDEIHRSAQEFAPAGGRVSASTPATPAAQPAAAATPASQPAAQDAPPLNLLKPGVITQFGSRGSWRIGPNGQPQRVQ